MHLLDALEAAVPGGGYLVDGTFTAADIMMGYSLLLARRFKVLTPTAHPNVNAYMARLEGHPGFIKAQQKAHLRRARFRGAEWNHSAYRMPVN